MNNFASRTRRPTNASKSFTHFSPFFLLDIPSENEILNSPMEHNLRVDMMESFRQHGESTEWEALTCSSLTMRKWTWEMESFAVAIFSFFTCKRTQTFLRPVRAFFSSNLRACNLKCKFRSSSFGKWRADGLLGRSLKEGSSPRATLHLNDSIHSWRACAKLLASEAKSNCLRV